MPRRFVLKVTKVSYSPDKPYMVRVPAALQKMEGSQRRFFDRESVAKSYVARLSREMGSYQAQALGLSDAQKIEAAECFERIKPFHVDLRDAVTHYLEYLATAGQSVNAEELVVDVLAAKEQDGASKRYLHDLRGKLGRFSTEFQGQLVCNISAANLEEWLRGLDVVAISRDGYRRTVSVALEFARRRGYVTRNVVADVEIKARATGEVTVLTPAQVEKLLKACEADIVDYVAVCAFAGLRPSEASLLTWEDIHFKEKMIEVKAKHSKTRRHRLVPIQPNLLKWLALESRSANSKRRSIGTSSRVNDSTRRFKNPSSLVCRDEAAPGLCCLGREAFAFWRERLCPAASLVAAAR